MLKIIAIFVHTWSFGFLAIEGFMMQSQFCQADLAAWGRGLPC
jgi:hypothetical protein